MGPNPRWVNVLCGSLLIALAAGAGWLGRHQTCESRCAGAVEQADRVAAAGDLEGALRRLDEADGSCGCAGFTEGDEPPEHASAAYYIEQLVAAGQADAARRILAAAEGPILSSLARAFPWPPRPR